MDHGSDRNAPLSSWFFYWTLCLILVSGFLITAMTMMQRVKAAGRHARERSIIHRYLTILACDKLYLERNCRITWFRIHEKLEILIPFARYEPGQRGLRPVASRTFWKKGVGWAGIAWENPNQTYVDDFHFEGSREKMHKDFKERLHLSDYMCGRVSEKMTRTVRMISRAISVGPHKDALGVISIDIWDRSSGLATADDVDRAVGFNETLETIAELETEFQLGR